MKSRTTTATVNVAYLNRVINKIVELGRELKFSEEGYGGREPEEIRADITERRKRLNDYIKRKQT